jgi:hypothetical protein
MTRVTARETECWRREDPEGECEVGTVGPPLRASADRRVTSWWGQTLEPPDFFGLQTEIEDFEIGLHVGGVGGTGQR